MTLIAGACGLPLDDTPRALSDEQIERAQAPGSTTTVPPFTDLPGNVEVTLYFTQGELVVFRRRTLDNDSLREVVSALLEGPSDEGLGTAIQPGTSLNDVELLSSVAVIDLSETFLEKQGEELTLATAQVVLTATDLDQVDAVQLKIDGEKVPIQLPNSEVTQDAVGKDDYLSLLSPDASPSTTARAQN